MYCISAEVMILPKTQLISGQKYLKYVHPNTTKKSLNAKDKIINIWDSFLEFVGFFDSVHMNKIYIIYIYPMNCTTRNWPEVFFQFQFFLEKLKIPGVDQDFNWQITAMENSFVHLTEVISDFMI